MVTYYNRKDLVGFANYLLKEKGINTEATGVSHADVENWKEAKRQEIKDDATEER